MDEVKNPETRNEKEIIKRDALHIASQLPYDKGKALQVIKHLALLIDFMFEDEPEPPSKEKERPDLKVVKKAEKN